MTGCYHLLYILEFSLSGIVFHLTQYTMFLALPFLSHFQGCKSIVHQHHIMTSDHKHHLVHGYSFLSFFLPWYNHLIVDVTSFVYIFFNSDHPAGTTPKKTSRTACRRKGFIMYKGTEHKADLGHFILVTSAVCTKVRQTNRVPQRNANYM